MVAGHLAAVSFPRSGVRTLLVVGQCALLVLGFALGGYWLMHQARAGMLNARNAGRWSTPGATELQTEAIAPPTTGQVIGRIEIPDVGIRAVILEGVGDPELDLGVGHIPGTALPGGQGNVSLAGHRDTHFRGLRDIQVGHSIRVTTDLGFVDYRVTSTAVVAPEATYVLNSSETDKLTLVTCHPFTFIGKAPNRFIVHAQRVAL